MIRTAYENVGVNGNRLCRKHQNRNSIYVGQQIWRSKICVMIVTSADKGIIRNID